MCATKLEIQLRAAESRIIADQLGVNCTETHVDDVRHAQPMQYSASTHMAGHRPRYYANCSPFLAPALWISCTHTHTHALGQTMTLLWLNDLPSSWATSTVHTATPLFSRSFWTNCNRDLIATGRVLDYYPNHRSGRPFHSFVKSLPSFLNLDFIALE